MNTQKHIAMKRYFCLCPGGLKSDSDASTYVESFKDVEYVLDSFIKDVGRDKCTYITQHIFDRSPDKFPHWGKTYMVIAVTKKGERLPVGYCNFEKTKLSSFSMVDAASYLLLAIAILMAVLSVIGKHYDAALWAFNCSVLVGITFKMKKGILNHKLLYLLK